jgi:hypothetical protein
VYLSLKLQRVATASRVRKESLQMFRQLFLFFHYQNSYGGSSSWCCACERFRLFTLKGLRPFPIEYFDIRDESKARQWLAGAD